MPISEAISASLCLTPPPKPTNAGLFARRCMSKAVQHKRKPMSKNASLLPTMPIHQNPREIEASEAIDLNELCNHRYEWASAQIAALITINPELRPFFLNAPTNTLHYVGLCLAAQTVRPSQTPGLEDLAVRIASDKRRAVLADLWNLPIGPLRLLRRMSKTVFSASSYVRLASLLANPSRSERLAHLGEISSLDIQRLYEASEDDLATFGLPLLSNINGRSLRFLVERLRCHRTDLSPDDLIERMKSNKLSALSTFVISLLKDQPFPDIPWHGTATIRPISTVRELQAAAIAYRNCLREEDIALDALNGRYFYYRCEGDEPCIARLIRLPLLSAWAFDCVHGKGDQPLSACRVRQIQQTFTDAGYPKVSSQIKRLVIGRGW